jgi:uncharacterized protein (TIGR00299 family) protein
MSRVLYFDCFSGISGDMVLGAFIDAGLPLDELKHALGSLSVSGFDVSAARVLRAGVSATKFIVHENAQPAGKPASQHEAANSDDRAHSRRHTDDHDHLDRRGSQPPRDDVSNPDERAHSGRHTDDHDHRDRRASAQLPPAAAPQHHHPHRTLAEINALIDQSALSPPGRDRAKGLFRRLGEAEGAIHQTPVEKVHLHEVGALDSIIDIVGAVFALEWVGADRIVCSPLNVGGGIVRSAHGVLPVPAPATMKLLGDAPIYSGLIQKELVTPTGALIATSYASAFGPLPAMSVERVGYGAGDRDHPETPNVLRVLIGSAADQPEADRVVVIECEIDDMNPQIFGVAMDRLYAAGALEVFYVPVQMKKNRPGTLLTVIAPPGRREALTDLIFRETTTIGLRHHEVERECLRREIIHVETPIGTVRFKLAWRDGRIVNAVPEFEDCAKLAAAGNLPLKEVQAIAAQAYGALQSRRS